MNDPVFHIGYVKTATTFLQRHVFSRADLGMALAGGPHSRGHVVAEVVLADDYIFDPAALAARFAELEAPQRAQGLLPIWSEEVLLGDPLAGRYDGPANLRRLHAAFPRARILITIREQRAMALSMLREYAKQGSTAPPVDVIGTGHEDPAFRPLLRPDFLHLERAVGFCRDTFGPDRVLVLPQEMLRSDPGNYFDRMGRFLDLLLVPPKTAGGDNVGRGLAAAAFNRGLNRLVRRSPLRRDAGLAWRAKDRAVRLFDRAVPQVLDARIEARLRAMIEDRYRGEFAAGNRVLAEMTGLDLGSHGYDLG
jgi:hypothetical protein